MMEIGEDSVMRILGGYSQVTGVYNVKLLQVSSEQFPNFSFVFLCHLEGSRVNFSMVVQRDCPKRKNSFKPCDLNI